MLMVVALIYYNIHKKFDIIKRLSNISVLDSTVSIRDLH